MSHGVARVLVGATLTPSGDRVVEAGLALAGALGVGVRLVHVLPPGASPACREERRRRLSALAQPASAPEVEVELREGREAAELLRDLDREPSTLLVVGAHESEGVLGKRLGDTTTELVRRAAGPVLVVRHRCAVSSARALLYFPQGDEALVRARELLGLATLAPSAGAGRAQATVELGRSERGLRAHCHRSTPDLVVLPLPPSRGALGAWRRRHSRRLAEDIEASVLLVPA